jgi:hypothetical protein
MTPACPAFPFLWLNTWGQAGQITLENNVVWRRFMWLRHVAWNSGLRENVGNTSYEHVKTKSIEYVWPRNRRIRTENTAWIEISTFIFFPYGLYGPLTCLIISHWTIRALFHFLQWCEVNIVHLCTTLSRPRIFVVEFIELIRQMMCFFNFRKVTSKTHIS